PPVGGASWYLKHTTASPLLRLCLAQRIRDGLHHLCDLVPHKRHVLVVRVIHRHRDREVHHVILPERRHQRDLITQQHRHRHQVTPHRHHRQPHTHHNSPSNSTVSLTTPPHVPKPPCCGVIPAYHTPKMVRNPLPRGHPPQHSPSSWPLSSKSSLPHPNRPRPMSKQGEPWGFLVRKKFLNRACGGGPRPLCGLFAIIKRVLCLPFAKVPGLVKREAAIVRGLPRSEEHTSELQSRENLVC